MFNLDSMYLDILEDWYMQPKSKQRFFRSFCYTNTDYPFINRNDTYQNYKILYELKRLGDKTRTPLNWVRNQKNLLIIQKRKEIETLTDDPIHETETKHEIEEKHETEPKNEILKDSSIYDEQHFEDPKTEEGEYYIVLLNNNLTSIILKQNRIITLLWAVIAIMLLPPVVYNLFMLFDSMTAPNPHMPDEIYFMMSGPHRRTF